MENNTIKQCYITRVEGLGYVLVKSESGRKRNFDYEPAFKGCLGLGKKTESEARSMAYHLGYEAKRLVY
jgi:hypothetical protein